VTDINTETPVEGDEVELTEYTSESEGPVSDEPTRRASATVPGAATGRRKQAIARVRIVPGTGDWKINGRTLEQYFPNKVHQQIVNEPLTLLELDGAYDILVRVHGGGPSGQAGAVRLGVARSLNGIDEELNRPALKKAGFLKRDSRVPERKKAGLKKARKAPLNSTR
jgi:small subunit ribosomal protein S9